MHLSRRDIAWIILSQVGVFHVNNHDGDGGQEVEAMGFKDIVLVCGFVFSLLGLQAIIGYFATNRTATCEFLIHRLNGKYYYPGSNSQVSLGGNLEGGGREK